MGQCDCFISTDNTLRSCNCQPFNGNGEQIRTNFYRKTACFNVRGCTVSRFCNLFSWYIIKFVDINCIKYSDIWIGNVLILERPKKKIDVSFETSFVATKGAWKETLGVGISRKRRDSQAELLPNFSLFFELQFTLGTARYTQCFTVYSVINGWLVFKSDGEPSIESSYWVFDVL